MDNENISLEQRINKALLKSENFKEQVKLSLLGVNEVLRLFSSLEDEYSYTLELLVNLSNEIQGVHDEIALKKEDFDTKLEQKSNDFTLIEEQIRTHQEQIQLLANQVQTYISEDLRHFENAFRPLLNTQDSLIHLN